MMCILKNDNVEVLIRKENDIYHVNIKSGSLTIEKEFNTRIELLSTLENSFSENAFYQIP